jgi:hypothetical protein
MPLVGILAVSAEQVDPVAVAPVQGQVREDWAEQVPQDKGMLVVEDTMYPTSRSTAVEVVVLVQLELMQTLHRTQVGCSRTVVPVLILVSLEVL